MLSEQRAPLLHGGSLLRLHSRYGWEDMWVGQSTSDPLNGCAVRKGQSSAVLGPSGHP